MLVKNKFPACACVQYPSIKISVSKQTCITMKNAVRRETKSGRNEAQIVRLGHCVFPFSDLPRIWVHKTRPLALVTVTSIKIIPDGNSNYIIYTRGNRRDFTNGSWDTLNRLTMLSRSSTSSVHVTITVFLVWDHTFATPPFSPVCSFTPSWFRIHHPSMTRSLRIQTYDWKE